MATILGRMRFAAAALALAFIVACAAPVAAQPRNPDGSVNPTASSVKEDQLLGALDRGFSVAHGGASHYVHIEERVSHYHQPLRVLLRVTISATAAAMLPA